MRIVDNETWGLLSAANGWREWFAWRPVWTCGRWRWFGFVQRRSDGPLWEYRAGRTHDYPDGSVPKPMHFYTYTCRFCGARFTI